MKKWTERLNRIPVCGLALGLAAWIWVPAAALAGGAPATGGMMMNRQDRMDNHHQWAGQRHEMMMRREQMMRWHQKFQTEIKKQDVSLQKLVSRMNTAHGPKKTDLMARLLTRLVHDRMVLNKQMARMNRFQGRPVGNRSMSNRMPARHQAMMGHMGRDHARQ